MESKSECCCDGGVRLIYSCSGASDVGEIADRVARKLAKSNCGGMTCLAAIGAHLSGFVESAKGADLNITIDGCSAACAKKGLEHIGIKPKSYILTEMGLVKGKSAVIEQIICEIVGKIKKDSGRINERPAQNSCCCG